MDGSASGRRAVHGRHGPGAQSPRTAGGGAEALAALIVDAGQLVPGATWRQAGDPMPPMLEPEPALEAVATRRAELGARALGQVWLIRYQTPAAAARAAERLAGELATMARVPPSAWRPEVGQAAIAARVELAASSTGPRPTLAIVFGRGRHVADAWAQEAGVSRAHLVDYARRLDALLAVTGD
jgi:hypothetical protein